MTGPKHLWSGNWEDEDSSSVPDALLERPAAARAPEPVPPPAQSKPQPKTTEEPDRPRVRVPVWVALGVAIVVAGVGAAILNSAGSSPKARTAAVSSTPTPTVPSLAATTPTTTQPPAPTGHPVEWLGMELVTVPPGGATVETIKLGGEGDRAGLSPGDVILEINGQQVSGADAIAKAISGKHAGDKVALQISHGSALYTTVVTLGASPTRYP